MAIYPTGWDYVASADPEIKVIMDVMTVSWNPPPPPIEHTLSLHYITEGCVMEIWNISSISFVSNTPWRNEICIKRQQKADCGGFNTIINSYLMNYSHRFAVLFFRGLAMMFAIIIKRVPYLKRNCILTWNNQLLVFSFVILCMANA